MRICFTVKRLEKMAGGAERVLGIVANSLACRGHDITLISFDTPDAESFYPLDNKIKWLRHPVGNSERPATFPELVDRIITLHKTIKEMQPDIVIGFMHSSFIPTALACVGLNIRVIGSEHISATHYLERKKDFALYFLSHFFIEKITVLSHSVKQEFPRWLRRKMIVVSNPVIKPELTEVSTRKSAKNFLTIGRLDKQKDQKTLINAFIKIASSHPEWHLNIVGSGPLREDLLQQVSASPFPDSIHIHPATKDIASFYKEADVFVIPSLYESFGMATIEAMMFGLPCIGFRSCPGTNELIVDKKNGYLIEDAPDRVTSLSQAMQKICENEEERTQLGSAALEYSKAYSVDPIIDQWESLIKGVSK